MLLGHFLDLTSKDCKNNNLMGLIVHASDVQSEFLVYCKSYELRDTIRRVKGATEEEEVKTHLKITERIKGVA